MSKDISNKNLATLVAIGVAISVIGLLVSFFSSPTITGAVLTNVTSNTGTTSLGVKGNLILSLVDSAVNLGDLEINESKNSEEAGDWFEIENEGSVDFDVYVYGASASDSPFASTTGGANTLPNSYYLVHLNSSDSGTPNLAINYTYQQVPATISNKLLLLSGLDNADSVDRAKIGISVNIPHDEQAGSKSADLTIYVEAS